MTFSMQFSSPWPLFHANKTEFRNHTGMCPQKLCFLLVSFVLIILISSVQGKLISLTQRLGKKKSVWEPGAQHTRVIITSVQAACHIWHGGVENRRGAAEKTKKSVCLQSHVFLFFLCQDGPSEDDKHFMLQR